VAARRKKKGGSTRTKDRIKRPAPQRQPKVRARAASRKPARKPPVAGAAPARQPTIFISYTHRKPSADIANKLRLALRPAADTWGAALFMDQSELEPGDLYDQKIVAALDRTTHFISLLNDEYWDSKYCQKELYRVLDRFEADRSSARLLFVKAGSFDETLYRIKTEGPIARVVRAVGDLQFLGPFDNVRRLVRLSWENEAVLGDQISELVRSLKGVIHK
jgi:hypothetical protein